MNPTPMTQRQAAYTATAKARAKGELVKPEHCERCGKATPYIYAHHPDYSKPLDVKWLCGSCHKQVHIEAGEVTHWRTGRVVSATSADERQAREDARWRRTRSIRIRPSYGSWGISPLGRGGFSKASAIQKARSLARQYGIPLIKLSNAQGKVVQMIHPRILKHSPHSM